MRMKRLRKERLKGGQGANNIQVLPGVPCPWLECTIILSAKRAFFVSKASAAISFHESKISIRGNPVRGESESGERSDGA